jgi:cytochrome P450
VTAVAAAPTRPRPGALDLSDPDTFRAGPPWSAFAELRRDAPVSWNPETAPNAGFWSVTRYADVVAVGREPETFTTERSATMEELDEAQLAARRSMLETDGPRHRALRRLLMRDFSPRSLSRYETFLRGLTALTLDAALATGELDFAAEVSADYPGRILARMLDLPDGDIGRLIEWGNRLSSNTDPEDCDVLLYSADSGQYRELPFRSPTALEVYAYGDELKRQRQGNGRDDLVSRLVNTEPEDGIPLSEQDFRNYFLVLVVAGNETSRHAITASMLALIEHPEQRALLQDRPELIPTAVEEFLRWSSPVNYFRRTAVRDVDLAGTPIRAGDKVVTWFSSANRDPEVFSDPDTFDVTRSPNEHLTFGAGGPHFCLGAALARLELRVMFEELLPRLDSVQLAGPLRRVRSNFVNGIKSMPIRVS